MAESREKSAQEFYDEVWAEANASDSRGDWPIRFAEAYAKYRGEAGRRDALEEAMKAICYWCRKEVPVEPTDEWPYLWHRDTASGGLYVCQAAAIRALK